MDLNSLKIYVDVVRARSFTSVAKERRIDPSSVSRTIAALEKELGVRLLQRTTRRLVPTEAGMLYYERVCGMVDEIIAAGSCAAAVSDQPRGILRVTAPVAFGLRCIVPLLPDFLGRYPELQVDLQLTDTVVDYLSERTDVAVRLGLPPLDATSAARKLIDTSYRVCASPSYLRARGIPQQPADVREHNCLRFSSREFRTRWMFRDPQQQSSEVPITGNVILSDVLALREAALAGMGLALLPNWLVGEDLERGALQAVLQTFEAAATDFNTAAWLLYPSRPYIPAKVKRFIDCLCQAWQPAYEWLPEKKSVDVLAEAGTAG